MRHRVPRRPGGSSVWVAGLLVCVAAGSVLAAREAPRSRTVSGLDRVGTWVAPPVDEAALLADNEARRREGGRPLRVGVRMTTDLGPPNAGTWQEEPTGDRRWRLELHSPGALWTKLGFDLFRLQAGGTLRVIGAADGRALGPFTFADIRPDGSLRLPPVAGDTIVVELDWPAELRGEQPALHIDGVSHGVLPLVGSSAFEPLTAGSCHIEVNCPLGDDWQYQKRGVVRLLIEDGQNVFTCSGSLINNTSLDCTPYVLTAEHCYADGGTPADTEFLFNYELPACEPGTVFGEQWQRGSTLRVSHVDSDHRLLELDSSPPSSWNLFFSGWSRATQPATESWTIHHPEGEYKKITHDADTLIDGIVEGPDHWRVVQWEEGSTDAGSSGGPLFDQNGRIVGELHRDTADCSNPEGWAEFGKFEAAWSNGLSAYLDPAPSTGATVLDGMDQSLCAAPAPRLSHAGHEVDDSAGFTNGLADPGESFLLETRLFNDGPLTATFVSATLSTPHALVAVTDGSAAWADVAPFETATSDAPHFNVDVDSDFPCGDAIPFELSITSAQGNWQSEFRLPTGTAVGLQQPPPFADDMESGVNGWTPQELVGSSPWSQVATDSNSPTHSWYVPNVTGVRDSLLIMPTVASVPPRATLGFMHRMDSDSGDGGVLEYSTDGSTWVDAGELISTGPYNSLIPTGFSSPIGGRAAWAGDLGGWRPVSVDLAALAGESLALRWRFASDTFGGGFGWYVDDVVLDAPVLQCVTCTDLDNDGFCPPPDGDDCNDGDRDVYPGAPQVCDGVNNDCDDPAWPGLPANEVDGDADGLTSCAGDCNGADSAVHPSADELCDGRDNDCDGQVDNDAACDLSCDAAEPAGDVALVTVDPSTSVQPALVWNGAGYGVVWSDARDGNLEVYFSRLDPYGDTLVGEVRLTNASADSFDPSLVWTGDGYAVSWCDERSGPPDAYFARLDVAGNVLGSEVVLGSCRADGNTSLAWSGSEYGVAWVDAASEIRFARVDAAGVEVGDVILLSDGGGTARAPALVWAGSEYGVVWHGKDAADDTQIFFTRVGATGSEVGGEVAVTSTPAPSRVPSLVWNGAGYGVAYNEGSGSPRSLMFSRIDANGNSTGAVVQVTTGVSAGSERPSVSWSGEEYGVVWRDLRDGNGEVYFARIAASGGRIGAEMRWTDDPADSVARTIVWNGTEYGIAWSRTPEIGFARLGCNCFDDDGDGWSSCNDNCDLIFNPDQSDADLDHEGDPCDLDDGRIHVFLSGPSALSWQQELGFDAWNVYKGDLDVLRDSMAYTQSPGSNDLAERTCGVAAPPIADGDPPATHKTAFFLVTGVDGVVESGLGTDSAGTPRPNTHPCP